jgi:hypothetical protein
VTVIAHSSDCVKDFSLREDKILESYDILQHSFPAPLKAAAVVLWLVMLVAGVQQLTEATATTAL